MIIKDLVVTGLVKLIRHATIRELVVDAINQVTKEEIDTLKGVTSNIQEQINSISNTVSVANTNQTTWKTAIANAINRIKRNPNNAELSSDSELSTFVNHIGNIEHGPDVSGVTATADKVLEGNKFVDSNWDEVIGNIPDMNGCYTIRDSDSQLNYGTTTANGDRTTLVYFTHIPRGYYGDRFGKGTNGEIQIECNHWNKKYNLSAGNVKHGARVGSVLGTYDSDGTITSSGMKKGLIGYSKGQRIVGTAPQLPHVLTIHSGKNKVVWFYPNKTTYTKFDGSTGTLGTPKNMIRLSVGSSYGEQFEPNYRDDYAGDIWGFFSPTTGSSGERSSPYFEFLAEMFGDANKNDVLEGKTFTSNYGGCAKGTMHNYAVNPELGFSIHQYHCGLSNGVSPQFWRAGIESPDSNNWFVMSPPTGYHAAANDYIGVTFQWLADNIGLTSHRDMFCSSTLSFLGVTGTITDNGTGIIGDASTAGFDSSYLYFPVPADTVGRRASSFLSYGNMQSKSPILRISKSTLISSIFDDFGNCDPSQVLSGRTFTSQAGYKVQGTMRRNAPQTYNTFGLGNANNNFYLRMPLGAYVDQVRDNYWEAVVPYRDIANIIGLTGDKIVSGTTVLGINGTADGDMLIPGIKSTDFSGTIVSLSNILTVYNCTGLAAELSRIQNSIGLHHTRIILTGSHPITDATRTVKIPVSGSSTESYAATQPYSFTFTNANVDYNYLIFEYVDRSSSLYSYICYVSNSIYVALSVKPNDDVVYITSVGSAMRILSNELSFNIINDQSMLGNI